MRRRGSPELPPSRLLGHGVAGRRSAFCQGTVGTDGERNKGDERRDISHGVLLQARVPHVLFSRGA